VLTLLTVGVHAGVRFLLSGDETAVAGDVAVFRAFALTQFAWIVSYFGLIAFAIYQAMPVAAKASLLDSLWPWYSLAMITQIMWIVCGYFNLQHISLGIAFLGIGAQIGLYFTLAVERPPLLQFSNQDRGFIYFPLSLFFGWSIFNVVELVPATLRAYNITNLFLDNAWWVVILMLLVAMIACFFLLQTQDLPLAVIMGWGLFGVYLENFREMRIGVAALVCLLMIMAAAGVAIYQWLQMRKTAVSPNDYF
jgi:hypothetical protein